MTLGEKLQALRKARGLSQEQLALELNVSRQAVSKWELGESVPDLDKLRALCTFFGVTGDYLIWDEQTAAPSGTAAQAGWTDTKRRADGGARKGNIRAFARQNGKWAGYIVAILGGALLLRSLLSIAAFYMLFESSNSIVYNALGDVDLGELMPRSIYSASLTAAVPYLALYAALLVGGLLFARWYKRRQQSAAEQEEGTAHDDI